MEGRQPRQRFLYGQAIQIMADSLGTREFCIDSLLMFQSDIDFHMNNPYGWKALPPQKRLRPDTLYLDIHKLLNLPRPKNPLYFVEFSPLLGDSILLAWTYRKDDWIGIKSLCGISLVFYFYFDAGGHIQKIRKDTLNH